MRDIVDRKGVLRNSGQNIEQSQTPQNYGNARSLNPPWIIYLKDRYSDQQGENQMPDGFGLNADLTATSMPRPSSEPLTPHYHRSERMQRSETESPVIKSESAMMPHTPIPSSQLGRVDAGSRLLEITTTQAPTPGRSFRQAGTPQSMRTSGGSAESYQLGGPDYAHTNAGHQPSLYSAPYHPTYSYNATSAFSEATNPRAADQPRLPVSAAAPPFYSPSPHPRHHRDKSLQLHYDSLRHHPRGQQYQGLVASQFTSGFGSFQPDLTMSLSFDTREGPFPDYPQNGLMDDPGHEEMHHQQTRYPSPGPPLSVNPYNSQPTIDTNNTLINTIPELQTKSESDAPTPGRAGAITKPDREITKDADGRFVCSWPGCTEEVRNFGRKCEWSKHMDKHDRPYKCPNEGCEKLPGFTYSGGLLRHQREVHNLHGGPRKQLNCPHPTCKRYSGKGFSRQENLNEHLRRVHTDGSEMPVVEDLTEDEPSERPGMKRKRGSNREDDFDWRQELARLRQENEDMKRTTESLMRQLQSLQGIVGSSIQRAQQSHQAPPANML